MFKGKHRDLTWSLELRRKGFKTQGMAVHICNLSAGEGETDRSLGLTGQPACDFYLVTSRLVRETLP